MFIALSRDRSGVNTLEVDGVELVGEYAIMQDAFNYLLVFFEDDRQFHIDFVDQTVTIMQDDDVLLNEYAGSLEFLQIIADEIRGGFPRYEAYTDTDFNDYANANNVNSEATQSLNSYNSNNSNNSNRSNKLSVRSVSKRRRTRRTRRANRRRHTRR